MVVVWAAVAGAAVVHRQAWALIVVSAMLRVVRAGARMMVLAMLQPDQTAGPMTVWIARDARVRTCGKLTTI
jgi:hypothetical protein